MLDIRTFSHASALCFAAAFDARARGKRGTPEHHLLQTALEAARVPDVTHFRHGPVAAAALAVDDAGCRAEALRAVAERLRTAAEAATVSVGRTDRRSLLALFDEATRSISAACALKVMLRLELQEFSSALHAVESTMESRPDIRSSLDEAKRELGTLRFEYGDGPPEIDAATDTGTGVARAEARFTATRDATVRCAAFISSYTGLCFHGELSASGVDAEYSRIGRVVTDLWRSTLPLGRVPHPHDAAPGRVCTMLEHAAGILRASVELHREQLQRRGS